MTWLDNTPPETPRVKVQRRDDYCLFVSWEPVRDATPVVYNIYREDREGNVEMVAHHLKTTHYLYVPSLPQRLNDTIIVRAMDAFGNESL